MKRTATTEKGNSAWVPPSSKTSGTSIFDKICNIWNESFNTTRIPSFHTAILEQSQSGESKTDKEMVFEAVERGHMTWERYAELNLKRCAEYAPDEFVKLNEKFLETCATKQNISKENLDTLLKIAQESIAGTASKLISRN